MGLTGGELQALTHDCGGDEELGGDLLISHAVLLAQRLEGAELIERMQGLAHRVLGERVLLGRRRRP